VHCALLSLQVYDYGRGHTAATQLLSININSGTPLTSQIIKISNNKNNNNIECKQTQTGNVYVPTKVDQNKIKINTVKNNVADSECDDACI